MTTSDVDEYGIPVLTEPGVGSARKRRAMMDAAVDEFLRAGYAACSVDAIAGKAGVSKPTVYNHFGSKERLFLAAISGRLREAYTELQPLRDTLAGAEDIGLVVTYLSEWVRIVLREDLVRLRRLVIGEVDRFPQLGMLWARINYKMNDVQLMAAFAALERRGLLSVPDPELAVRQLVGMTIGAPQLVRTFLPHEPLGDLDAIVRSGVEVFCSHYGRS